MISIIGVEMQSCISYLNILNRKSNKLDNWRNIVVGLALKKIKWLNIISLTSDNIIADSGSFLFFVAFSRKMTLTNVTIFVIFSNWMFDFSMYYYGLPRTAVLGFTYKWTWVICIKFIKTLLEKSWCIIYYL